MFTLEEAYKAIARLENYIQRKLLQDEIEHVLSILVHTSFPSCNPADLVKSILMNVCDISLTPSESVELMGGK